MRDRGTGWGCPRLERLLEQILVVVASTPSGEGRHNPAVCGWGLEWSRFPHQTAVECGSTDREPSGKFTGQPKLPPQKGAQEWQTGKQVQHSAV